MITEPYYSEEILNSLEYLDLPVPRRGRLHAVIIEDPISQLNAPKPIVLRVDDPVSKAARLMMKFRFGSVLVIDGETLAGIFTEKDLLRCTSAGSRSLDGIPLSEVMTASPSTVEETDTIAHALHLMAVGGYRHVPIVKEGRPVGFCSIRGILRYITENSLTVG